MQKRLTAFFFFLGLAASPVVGAPSALAASVEASPLASASLTSPGTDLLPRRPVLFLRRFCFFSLSFSLLGLASAAVPSGAAGAAAGCTTADVLETGC